MKIVTIVGARPQFIKAAAVSRKLRKCFCEILVHTGQHYDKNMSDIFFEEMNIPIPDYNLNVGSGSHAEQTGKMLIGIETILLKEKPDFVLVYGDTNSTLAGALAASKILIPVIHVEAGLRSFNKNMPEEQNRILTDHLATYLFCPTDTAVQCLKSEGINQNVFQVGDVMCDAVLYYSNMINAHTVDYYFGRLKGIYQEIPLLESWYLTTIHRAENTNSEGKVKEILDALENLNHPVIFLVHPRIKPIISQLESRKNYINIFFAQPVGYIDMLFFVKNALKIITDSGGLQKEAYILGTGVVTIREQTEWIETLIGNWNVLCKPTRDEILEKVLCTVVDTKNRKLLYGDGKAADRICEIITRQKTF